MAEDEGKQEEDEKLEFTPEGETLGYVSLPQATLIAIQAARESPGNYAAVLGTSPWPSTQWNPERMRTST